jgi:hypothetical protein
MFVTQGRSDGNLFAGEVAANLTVADMLLPNQEDMNIFVQNHDEARNNLQLSFDIPESLPDPMLFMFQFLQAQSVTSINLPVLTEEEKQSPLGAALCYIMGLFMSMRQYILESREQNNASVTEPSTLAKASDKQPPRGTTRFSLPTNEDEYEPPTKRRVAQVSDHSSDGDLQQRIHRCSFESTQPCEATIFRQAQTFSYNDQLSLNECSSFPINISDLDLSSHALIDQKLSRAHSIDTNAFPDSSCNGLYPLPYQYS